MDPNPLKDYSIVDYCQNYRYSQNDDYYYYMMMSEIVVADVLTVGGNPNHILSANLQMTQNVHLQDF